MPGSEPSTAGNIDTGILCCADLPDGSLTMLAKRYGVTLVQTREGSIPGSYWGDSEAGLLGNRLYVRADTPVHSALHELCHYVCMPPAARLVLDTNAGGDYDEENAVCYLQILLSDRVAGMGRERMMRDMDAWGYTFRLGSAKAWFTHDADDARLWLARYALTDDRDQPAWSLRERP